MENIYALSRSFIVNFNGLNLPFMVKTLFCIKGHQQKTFTMAFSNVCFELCFNRNASIIFFKLLNWIDHNTGNAYSIIFFDFITFVSNDSFIMELAVWFPVGGLVLFNGFFSSTCFWNHAVLHITSSYFSCL